MLFNTLFGSQEGRQQQHGGPQETAPQDSPVASQGYAQAGTETAEMGTPTSDAHRSAEVSLAEETADTDGAARYDQTAYGRPSNRPATRAGFAPGMESLHMALQSHLILLVVHLHEAASMSLHLTTTKHRAMTFTQSAKAACG